MILFLKHGCWHKNLLIWLPGCSYPSFRGDNLSQDVSQCAVQSNIRTKCIETNWTFKLNLIVSSYIFLKECKFVKLINSNGQSVFLSASSCNKSLGATVEIKSIILYIFQFFERWLTAFQSYPFVVAAPPSLSSACRSQTGAPGFYFPHPAVYWWIRDSKTSNIIHRFVEGFFFIENLLKLFSTN